MSDLWWVISYIELFSKIMHNIDLSHCLMVEGCFSLLSFQLLTTVNNWRAIWKNIQNLVPFGLLPHLNNERNNSFIIMSDFCWIVSNYRLFSPSACNIDISHSLIVRGDIRSHNIGNLFWQQKERIQDFSCNRTGLTGVFLFYANTAQNWGQCPVVMKGNLTGKTT